MSAPIEKYDAVTATKYHMEPYKGGLRIAFRNTQHGPRRIWVKSEDEFMKMGADATAAAEEALRALEAT